MPTTMKTVRWHAPRDMRLEEAPIPTPKPHEALIRIESCGVCGSDMHYYLDGHIGSQVLTKPTVLGHEYAGIVEAVGAEADPSLLGKRVAVEPGIPCFQCEWCRTGHYNVCCNMFFPGGPGCDGAFAEYIAVHAAFCFPVPAGMSAPIAAMIEPLAVALHTVELAELKVGESAAVIGLGPIGLLTAMCLKLAGAEVVYGADLLDYRVAVSQKFGVDHATNAGSTDTVSAIWAATAKRGVDVAFDCTNRGDGIATACRVTRPAGRCVLTGISGNEEDSVPVSTARRRELTFRWCRRFKNNFPAAIRLIDSGRLDVQPLITHSLPLSETLRAFEIVSGYRENVLKASIDQ